MKKFIPTLIIASILLAACTENTTPVAKNTIQTGTQTTKSADSAKLLNKISLQNAYAQMKNKIDLTMKDKNGRLGKVRGSNVTKDCQASTWIYLFYNDLPKEKDYIESNTFTWNNKKIITGNEKIMSIGLNSTDYEYLKTNVGNAWQSCNDIVSKIYDDTPNISSSGLQVDLTWNSNYSKDAPVWIIDLGARKPKRIFNAVSKQELENP